MDLQFLRGKQTRGGSVLKTDSSWGCTSSHITHFLVFLVLKTGKQFFLIEEKKYCFIQAKSVAKQKTQVVFLFPPSATGSPSATAPLTLACSSCSIHVPTKLNTKVNLCFKTLHGSIVEQMALEDPNTIDPGRAIYSLRSHHRYLKMHTGRKCASDWDLHAIYPGDTIWASPF